MFKHYFIKENLFFILMLFLCIVVLFHFIFPFGLGITFAYLLEPILEKVVKTFKIQHFFWKSAISLFIILITFFLILGPFLTIVTTSIQELIAVLSTFQSDLRGKDLVTLSAQKTIALFQYFGFDLSVDEIVYRFSELLKSISSSILSEFGTALSATPEFVLKLIVFIFSWFFFLLKGKEWRLRFLLIILPWRNERELITRTCSSVLKALIVANIFVAFAQAFLITISLALFGLPRFILLGMIGFFISFIPVIGTAPLMLGAAAWCYFYQGRLLAAIGILVCGVLISIFDNVLRPLFMKEGVELQFFWIFLAIICGLSLFGIPGAVLGPVVFALFASALKALELAQSERKC